MTIAQETLLLRNQKYGGVPVIANLQRAQKIREKYGWTKVTVMSKAEHIVHLGRKNVAVVDQESANPIVLDYAEQKEWVLIND